LPARSAAVDVIDPGDAAVEERHTEASTLRSSRREAWVVLAIWIAAMTYTVGYCTQNAYGRTWDEITFVLGFPDWVFWGILVPWSACLVASVWFAFGFMTDESLGPPDEDAAELDAAGDA
jgi:hypothetical protein